MRENRVQKWRHTLTQNEKHYLSELLADAVSGGIPVQSLAPGLPFQEQVPRHPGGVRGGLEAAAFIGRLDAQCF